MFMKKTVWIPVTAMANRPERSLLELIIERGAWQTPEKQGLMQLTPHGLSNAAQLAEQALRHAKLLPHYFCGYYPAAPYIYTSNPVTGLSNTNGAALGIALGLLMYAGNLPNNALIASGGLATNSAQSAGTRVQNTGAKEIQLQAIDKIAEKLELALNLPRPAQPLGFVLPAHTQTGLDIQQTFKPQIQALQAHNIYPLPSPTLQAAVQACRELQ